ncbi:MAG TPA: Uma2 family endonuclease [Methylomirabilota bacterium]|jgi:Uma2 family endonuclease|nr:Uma2 family endonuclease [Methylomirabilota bacterium]
MSRLPPVKTRRFTRVEYDRLVEQGFFGDERLELLDGLLVFKEPQGSRHAAVVGLVRVALERAFGPRYHCRDHAPIALDRLSEPEPDVAVVPGRIEQYVDAHPAEPVLVVEVADSSLAKDRLRKSALYARARLADYWVVNLVDEVLEVYRDPVRMPVGWRYKTVTLLRRGATVRPLAAPRARIRVRALLP